MKIIAVDDEARPINLMRILLSEIDDADFVQGFTDPLKALEFLKHNKIDLVFLDIEMPEISGIDLALLMGKLPNPPQIVFVTAYSQYAIDAWKTEAVDYILKPYDTIELKRAVERAIKHMEKEEVSSLLVRCFPHFDVLINKKPVVFRSKRAKELLAYLVHNQNGWVNISMMVYDIFGDLDEKSSKSHYRVILSRLKSDLSAYGLANIIETQYGKIRANVKEKECDYYRYLNGEEDLFLGEYLQEYSWAETECTRMRTKHGL